ncbi:MAG: methyltransferase domain-containing protein [Gammaproteobacteria bacterium]|nr:methyltransferase domain-containing protein [Gammaproteobacteria bacterium]
MLDSTRWYQENAREAAKQYEAVAAEDIHGWLKRFLPENPGRILDIGAGSGRDAAWLSELHHQVIAVEPSPEMRKEGRRWHPGTGIRWRNDSLPSLRKLSKQEPFDLILINGVWQHVERSDRKRAFRKTINLLKPDGSLAISLRHGPEVLGRKAHAVSVEEIESLARDHGAFVAYQDEVEDGLGREGICWTNLVIRFPDDGTGELPLLRHIILKQSKSATHKLGLLRTLCRIADGAPGIARANDDGSISLPMGLVALIWLRLYKPLLKEKLPQLPSKNPKLGFVKAAYKEIELLSHLDFRIGMRFGKEQGPFIHQALRDVAANIRKMPIKYMTYPGKEGKPVLQVKAGAKTRSPREVWLDKTYLYSFGEARVPESLWQALRKHAVWVEPVVIAEWAEMMRGYAQKQGRVIDERKLRDVMAWADPERDVKISREQAMRLLENRRLYCVWSGSRLREQSLDIDHCLPWSVWSCSDLWNLMPANRRVNQNKKKNFLPSESVMDEAQNRILEWWDQAYFRSDSVLQEKFLVEASASLPGIRTQAEPCAIDLEEIFESVCLQRAKLSRDQQVPEWAGLIEDI